MPDGAPLRFPSAVLTEPWPAPIPGKSMSEARARKQDAPPDCGSIYTPEPGSIPVNGVPCRVPERADESLEAARARCIADITAMAYDKQTHVVNELTRIFDIGARAAQTLEAHPELVYEETPQPPKEAAPKREARTRAKQEENLEALADKAQRTLDSALEALNEPEEEQQEEHNGVRRHGASLSEPRRASIYAKLKGLMDLSVRVSARLNASIAEQARLGYEMVQHGFKRDLKAEFMENRAVAVVKNTLLHLDDGFRDLGFGGWMPFRYPDQWLMFNSLMRKALAAFGLIVPKGPNVWKKLLEETPEVEEEMQMPQSWGPTKKYEALASIEEVLKQAKEKTRLDAAARKRFDERFAMGP